MHKITISIIISFIFINLKAQVPTTKDGFLITDYGTELFVQKSGDGPVCIFIHGGPGAWSKTFKDLGGDNLETNLTMVYYDQRGSGRSEKSLSDNYSIDRMVEDIELIRKYYQSEKVYLLAHSFGGILAVNYAKKYPGHLNGLILANSTLSLPYSLNNQIMYINQLLKTNFTPPDHSSAAIMSTFIEAKKALSAKKLTYKTLSDRKKSVDALDKIDDKNPSDYDFAQKAFDIGDYWNDYTKITQQIEVPVLIITGKKDHSVGKDHYLQFNFMNEQVKRINGGHLLYYENNEEFINSIFEFVKENTIQK